MTHNYMKHAADALKYWGYVPGDGMSAVQQSYWQAYSATQNSSEETLAFLDGEMCEWENILFDGNGDHVMRVRESLVLSISINKCTFDETSWIFGRYLSGAFDSVSDHHLMIGRVYAHTSVMIKAGGDRARFNIRPGQMDEVDVSTMYSSIGRTNIVKLDVSKFSCEGSSATTILGLRSKLPGSRFVKVRDGNKTYLRGYRDLEVPHDFPVEVCEEFEGRFYVVYPYGQGSLPPEFAITGEDFVEHPWVTPSNYVMESWADGVMVLTLSGEFRAKSVPTEEISENGVWEVAYGIRYGTGSSGLMLIRPRPGKKPVTRDQAIKVLKSVAPARDILRGIPSRTRPIVVNRTGPFRKMVEVFPDLVRIDSGNRDRVVEQLPADDIRTVRRRQIGLPPAHIYGSKLLIVGTSCGMPMFALIEETPGKPFDLPGGTRILGESADGNLIREIREELHMDIEGSMPYHLGRTMSKVLDDGKSAACSDMYVMPLTLVPSSLNSRLKWIVGKDIYKLSHNWPSNTAKWVGRFMRYVQSLFPTPADLLSFTYKSRCGFVPRDEVDRFEDDSSSFVGWKDFSSLPIPSGGVVFEGIAVNQSMTLLDSSHQARMETRPVEGFGVVIDSPARHNPTRPGERRRDVPLVSSVPSISSVAPVGVFSLPPNQIAKMLVQSVPDDFRESPPPQSFSLYTPPVVVPHVPQSPSGQVLMPAKCSLLDIRSRDYGTFSYENAFYFVAGVVLGDPNIFTKEIYKRMMHGMNLANLRPGRILEDMIRMGWFIRHQCGNDHRVSINQVWSPI